MTNIKFLHKPGYIYDLITLFIFYFNREHWEKHYISTNSEQQDYSYIKGIMDGFLYASDETNIFFISNEAKGSFFINKYFLNYKEKIINNYDLDFLFSEISNTDDFCQRLLDFYFPDSGILANYKERTFFNSLSTLVKESSYNDNIKNRILLFFIDPEKYTEILKKELKEKDLFLTKIYQKQYKLLVETQEKFNFEYYTGLIKNVNKMAIDYSKYTEAYISICLVNRNVLSGFLMEGYCIQILGYQYLDSLEDVLAVEFNFDIDLFGKIISDKNRMEIINMLLKNPELSTSDIAKNLNASINSAYYHLDMMNQATMVKSRNEGRTVFYKINKEYFLKASDFIRGITENNNL